MKTLLNLSLICTLIVAMSCDETKKVVGSAEEVHLTGAYDVKMLNNNQIENNITIGFNPISKQINGDAGCNSYFGDYDEVLFNLTFSGMGSTKKMCQPDSVMKTEQEYLSALSNVGNYRLVNRVLTLYAKSNNAIVISAEKQE
ncbi:MAG: heat shock protein HslJ [Planctomycetota bacterium]|jgi:heat shock protein HslJ|uniref:META domain-containing protein n=1 Tax=Patiriisocius sp. Uisw_047 TaxID=3230969 RepID=UPI0039EBB75D